MFSELPLLSLVIWVPIAGAALVLALGDQRANGARTAALLVALATLALSIPLFTGFAIDTADMQFVEFRPWIESFGINYHLGVDGIAMPLIVLTTFTTVLVVIAGWEVIKQRPSQYMAAFLVMEGFINGVFAALDAALFYVFWEAMLIPMFIIIGMWGGPNRVYATIKFFLYTFFGSVFMLVALVYLYTQAGSFAILDFHAVNIGMTAQILIFLAFLVAFAVKVPMFPVHTWLPDAHVEAPMAGSVILAGVLLKMGAYGMLRFCLPFFPDATVAFAPYVVALSVIAIIYGALVSLVQKDLKKLVAYSSVSHMGFVTAGIFAAVLIAGNAIGMEGAILVMFSHGVLTGALFLLVGFLYERTHTRQISEMAMLATPLPVTAGFLLFFALGSLGLPGLSGFVGEFLSLLGVFEYSRWLAAIAAVGVILAAAYLLWMYQRVMFNDRGAGAVAPAGGMLDLGAREIVALLPLVVLAVWAGVYPNTFLQYLHVPVGEILAQVEPALRAAEGGRLAQFLISVRGQL